MVLGLAKTGPIITAAGVIMLIAFGSLLLSSLTILNQFGLLLALAVLLDTFLVRTALVPVLMTTTGAVNWWPVKMPDPLFSDTSQTLPALNEDVQSPQ